jgi:hypothetical protein
MSWISFNSYCSRFTSDPKQKKICLVLGAGIHNLLKCNLDGKMYEAVTFLSSCKKLAGSVAPQYSSKFPSILAWELTLLDSEANIKDSDKAVFSREIIKSKELAQEIKILEEIVLSSNFCLNDYSPLTKILQSGLVSDVISFNFDLIAERLCLTSPANQQNFSVLSQINPPFRLVETINSQTIRFWHPHGDYTNHRQLVFGAWRYARLLKQIEKSRKRFKEVERRRLEMSGPKVDEDPCDWLDLFMTQPLLFLGLSLDEADLTPWLALLIKHRNFAKSSNRSKMPESWRLCIPGDGEHIPSRWVQRLEARNYDDAWGYLNQHMTSPTK